MSAGPTEQQWSQQWSPPWWQPWTALALFAFLLLVWEFLQVPWYREMPTVPHWQGIRTCTIATAGDVVLLLSGHALSAAPARDGWWIQRPTRRAMAVFVTSGPRSRSLSSG